MNIGLPTESLTGPAVKPGRAGTERLEVTARRVEEARDLPAEERCGQDNNERDDGNEDSVLGHRLSSFNTQARIELAQKRHNVAFHASGIGTPTRRVQEIYGHMNELGLTVDQRWPGGSAAQAG